MWTQDVLSSMVSQIGYDEEKQELFVTWTRNKKRSVYSGVPEDVANDLTKAASVGEMINNVIKPTYSHRYG